MLTPRIPMEYQSMTDLHTSMATPQNPDVTITPAPSVDDIQMELTTPSIPLPKHIVHAFREVSKEIQPRWSNSDPIYVSVSFIIDNCDSTSLPFTDEGRSGKGPASVQELLPQDAMTLPPYLHYGLPR